MSDFSLKMCHQIQFRLGLRLRPRLGSSHRSPDPLAGFGKSGRKGEIREGDGKGGEEGSGERGGERRGGIERGGK